MNATDRHQTDDLQIGFGLRDKESGEWWCYDQTSQYRSDWTLLPDPVHLVIFATVEAARAEAGPDSDIVPISKHVVVMWGLPMTETTTTPCKDPVGAAALRSRPQ